MKSLLLVSVAALPLLLGACAPVVVDRHARRPVVVERDDYSYRHHPRARRDVVVVNHRPAVAVRYYNDPRRGRYYLKDGRRIYVSSGGRVY